MSPPSKGPSKLRGRPPEIIEPKKPKILIFGPPGVRKTWVACDFPQLYYIDTEGGADLPAYREKIRAGGGVYMGQSEGALDFDVIIEQIKALSEEKHSFRTLALDSASKLWNTAVAEEGERLGDKDEFGRSKKKPTQKFSSMIKALNRLDMTCLIICHQIDKWGVDERSKQRVQEGYTYDCEKKLEHELHLSLRIGLSGSGRSSLAYIGKSRLGSFNNGDNFPWEYSKFADLYGRDIIERAAEPLIPATEEQLAEMKHLFEVIKVPADWEDKVMTKENVEGWEEMPTARIEIHLNTLRGKLRDASEGKAA